jgi:glutamate--cysteine ligase
MEAHFDSIGPAGRRMMCNTAALQINVGGIDDAGWRVANLIGPPLIASFANSPGDAGCPSTRMTTWQATEPCRTDPVGLDRPLAAAWSDYALHACALMTAAGDGEFVRRPAATSFAHWLANGDSAGFPTAEDLDYHLTTLFPPVRPRGWFELRYFDALPSPYWEVATRVVAALLNPAVRDEVTRAMPARPSWVRAASVGLRDTTLGRAADACFALAIGATADDSIIEYNDRYVARRRCPADDAGVAPRESVWA